jgi:competence protein ComEC
MNEKKYIFIRNFLFISFFILFLSACGMEKSERMQVSVQSKQAGNQGELEIHFIDVGQGDATFIKTENCAMLIDAGENNDEELMVEYLKKQGVQKLDYLIGTHPHEDHIGGLDAVIREFDLDMILMPDAVHNSMTFEEVLDALEEKNFYITKPVVGTSYSFDVGEFTILAPNSEEYENTNNYSIALRLTYKENSFIFTGDAEVLAEKEILDSGLSVDADLLKAGHHGSATSNSEEFIRAVDPSYAVISVGKNNSYGHPGGEVLTRFEENDIQVYRTDFDGTIIAVSDGTHISFITTETLQTENEIDTIYVHRTRTGKKYHKEGCSSLNQSDQVIPLEEAKEQGLTPCETCRPSG